jgi:hypothetical protein
MLKTEREKAICRKYGAQDETGHVHCMDCPLVVDALMCKATCHYDKCLREWVQDEVEE